MAWSDGCFWTRRRLKKEFAHPWASQLRGNYFVIVATVSLVSRVEVFLQAVALMGADLPILMAYHAVPLHR
jgi:hypothetical protein